MNNSIIDVIVVGAGHAGLCISYYLTKHDINHIVFDQGRIGETWRSKRWDSFRMNSANKLNLLPEQQVYFNDPDAFASANEFALSLENYTNQLKLSVREYCRVIEVKKDEEQNIFVVTVSEDGNERMYLSRQIVIASGGQNGILIPAFANNISKNIFQIHTSEYLNPDQLPEGNVLVVGSAQSGTQIAEDLVRTNKKIFLSSSRVGRIPRRYRGRDIFDWFFELGLYDVFTDDVTDSFLLIRKAPQVSGVGERGKSSSLQSLARSGVVILGKAENADLDNIYFQPNAHLHVRYADQFSSEIKKIIDDYIQTNNLPAPLPEVDPDDIPDENASCASDMTILNLEAHNIKTIIWTTGFNGDYDYIKLPVLNEEKMPKHHNGISEVKGLYFIGLPWLRKRISGLIPGVNEDAEFIVKQILG